MKATTSFEKFSEAHISDSRNGEKILKKDPKMPFHELLYIFYTCFNKMKK